MGLPRREEMKGALPTGGVALARGRLGLNKECLRRSRKLFDGSTGAVKLKLSLDTGSGKILVWGDSPLAARADRVRPSAACAIALERELR